MTHARLRRRIEKLEATKHEVKATSTPLSDEALVQGTRAGTLRLSDADDLFEDTEAYLRGHVLATAMGHRLERFHDVDGITWRVRGIGGPITYGANVASYEPHEEPYFPFNFAVDNYPAVQGVMETYRFQRWVRTRLMENLFDGDPLALAWRAEIDAWWYEEVEPPGLWPDFDPHADALLTALDDNKLWDIGPPFIMPACPGEPAGRPEDATYVRWETTKTGFRTRGPLTYIDGERRGSREFVWPIPEGIKTQLLRIPPLHTPAAQVRLATTGEHDDD